ncbi:MAG: hypothetical protein DMF96_04715 [Acidobacteria bacterium]|nr:MAG: hypothetical protein DMF96_04715 [Acidobacteriota bacterium]
MLEVVTGEWRSVGERIFVTRSRDLFRRFVYFVLFAGVGFRISRALAASLGIRNWLAVILVLTGAVLHAGRQQATFTVGNRTVAVYATVTDSTGRLVPDLARDQFQIDDNGRRQELTLFANEIQPITVVMLLDRSGSMRANFDLVEKAAEQFVGVMLPADKARIGSFANRIQVDPRDFTSDHDELVRILRTELQPEGPTPLWNAVNVGITALLHQQGRRVILVFTDGVDAPMNFSASTSLKDVMKRAEEENVMVYAIGLASSTPSFAQGSRGGSGGGGGRRRLLRADVYRRSRGDLHARRRRAASSVRARVHAGEARRQNAHPAGEPRAGPRRAGPQELSGHGPAVVLSGVATAELTACSGESEGAYSPLCGRAA